MDAAVHARIEGVVRNDAGGPVRGVRLDMSLFREGVCDRTMEAPGEFPPTVADTAGRFERVLVLPLTRPLVACIELTAEPPAGTGLAVVKDTVMVEFGAESEEPPVTTVVIHLEGGEDQNHGQRLES
jgi:hypothetical protein